MVFFFVKLYEPDFRPGVIFPVSDELEEVLRIKGVMGGEEIGQDSVFGTGLKSLVHCSLKDLSVENAFSGKKNGNFRISVQ